MIMPRQMGKTELQKECMKHYLCRNVYAEELADKLLIKIVLDGGIYNEPHLAKCIPSKNYLGGKK